MSWISVKDHEKLPKPGTKCLAWLNRRKVAVTVIVEKDEQAGGPWLIWREVEEVPREYDTEDLVTHWMPLSKPPKEKP